MARRDTSEPAEAPVPDKVILNLAKLRVGKDADRLEHDRQARSLAAEIDKIDATIKTEFRRRKITTLDFGRYLVELVKKDGSVYYKGELEKLLGEEKFDELLASVPQKQKVEVTDRGEIPRVR